MAPLFAASTLGESFDLLALSPPGWGGTLLYGLTNSMIVAVGAYAVGLLIGTCGAVGKLYGGQITRDLLAVYTTLIRAVPDLVLILILFYAVPNGINGTLVGFGLQPLQISGLFTGIAVLGLVQGAYATEVLRGAILAVPHGQIEAARAFGMTPILTMRRITLPLMLANAIPGLANLWLIATKDTALLAVVGFGELTLVTQQAAATTKSYFIFFMAAGVLYLAITLISERIFSRIEHHARRGQPDLKGTGT